MSAFKGCLAALALVFAGCASSVHQVHTSDFTGAANGGNRIRATAEQFVILGFTDNTNYVEQAYHQLLAECPDQVISGITTEYSTSLGFFSWTHHILMQGTCLKPMASVK